jgi:hypothetical protein
MRSVRPPIGRRPAGSIFSAVSMTAMMNTQNSEVRQIAPEVLTEQG